MGQMNKSFIDYEHFESDTNCFLFSYTNKK